MTMFRQILHGFRIADQPPGIYSGFHARSLERVGRYTVAHASQSAVYRDLFEVKVVFARMALGNL
jgi:hypothetical protein